MYQLFLVAIINALPVSGNNGDKVNSVEFNEMCKIYRLALTTPERPRLNPNLNLKTETEAILDEIEKLDVLTSTNDSYRHISSKKEWSELVKDFPNPPSLTEEKYKAWQAAAEVSGIDPSAHGWVIKYKKPSNSVSTQMANLKIAQLLVEGRALAAKVIKLEGDVDSDIREARKKLCEAVFGTGLSSDKDGAQQCLGPSTENDVTFADNGHGKGCKSSGGAKAGRTIVNDIVCLCALASGASTQQFCGSNFVLASTTFNNPTNAGILWGKMKGKCGTDAEQPTFGSPSPTSIHRAITIFRSLLGKGAYMQAAAATHETAVLGANAILGHYTVAGSTAVACDGTWDPSGGGHGMCVDYRDHLHNGKEIPWVQKLEDAAKNLEQAQEKFTEVIHAYNVLKGVERAAQLSYLEAFHGHKISQMTIQTGNASDVSPTDGATGATKVRQPELTGTTSRVLRQTTASAPLFYFLASVLLF